MTLKRSEIAVFSFAYSPFEGGAEIAARELINRLKELNFTIFSYKFDWNWASIDGGDNYQIIRLGKGKKNPEKYGRVWSKIFYVFGAWRAAEDYHKKNRFQVIWAIMASYGGIAALLFKLNHPTIPLFLTVQEGDSEKRLIFGKFGLTGFWGGQIIKNSDYIQVISNYLRDFVKKRGAGAPVEVIPNGVDLEMFGTKYTNAELKSVRENLMIKDEYVVITTSRLVYKNAVDVLIEAIARCKNKMINVKCLVIGGGPEYKKLKAKSKRMKVDGNVLFLGQIPQKDLPLYFKISDIFVRPSRSEGLGSSFLEAMAAGVPVIGTPVGGIVDFLKDPSFAAEQATGLYAKVDDPEDLAQKIKMLLNDSGLKKRLIDNGRALVQESYSWDKIAKLFRNIFDKLINL